MTILSKKKSNSDKRSDADKDTQVATHPATRNVRLDSSNRNRNSPSRTVQTSSTITSSSVATTVQSSNIITTPMTNTTQTTTSGVGNRWSPARQHLDDTLSLNETTDSSDLSLSLNTNTNLNQTPNGLCTANTTTHNKRKLCNRSPSAKHRSVRSRMSTTKTTIITNANVASGTSGSLMVVDHGSSSDDDNNSQSSSIHSQNNSEDEYDLTDSKEFREYFKNQETLEEIEATFRQTLKEKKGFIIKPMKEDGACLFRAVADQIYGDEEMHSVTRNHCMDYIAKNSDYFKQYMTEDVDRYVSRKRHDHTHGNHIEMIALAEIFNRPIEVYEYSTEPKNTFQSGFQTDNEPIRLSYHGRNHYNSVIDPYKATIGVGLGLPAYIPGLAEKNLMNDAIKKSEDFHIEKTMLDDKMKATDWEATNEEIMELVARESYLQWLKDNEKRQTTNSHNFMNCNNNLTASSPMATCSSWDTTTNSRQSPAQHATDETQKSPFKTTTRNNNIKTVITNNMQHQHQQQQQQQTKSPKHQHRQTSNDVNSTNNDLDNENQCSKNSKLLQTSIVDHQNTKNRNENYEAYYETHDIINRLPPSLYGINDWDGDAGDDILAQILAVSQQEYIDNLKKNKNQQESLPIATNENNESSCNTTIPSTSSNLNNN